VCGCMWSVVLRLRVCMCGMVGVGFVLVCAVGLCVGLVGGCLACKVCSVLDCAVYLGVVNVMSDLWVVLS